MKDDKGYGLVQVIASAAILMVVVISVMRIIPATRHQQSKITSASSCEEVLSGIVDAIKVHDNSTIVRNWLPKASTAIDIGSHDTDPYCNAVNGRTPACDRHSLIRNSGIVVPNGGGTQYVLKDLADKPVLRNYQNVRGAFVWAQNVYNTRGNAICQNDGITLDRTGMENILPNKIQLPNFPQSPYEYLLFIQDTTVGCDNNNSSSRGAQMNIRVVGRYRDTTALNSPIKTCTRSITVAHNTDDSPPLLTVTRVYNGLGTPVGDIDFAAQRPILGTGPYANPPNSRPPLYYCSETRGLPGATTDTNRRNVNVVINVSEPGVIFLCRKEQIFDSDVPGEWQNCADLGLAIGATTMSTGEGVINYSSVATLTPPAPTLTLSGLQDRGPASVNDFHALRIKAIDTSGNESQPVRLAFNVGVPTCPATDTWCPNALPADHPSFAASGNPSDHPYWETTGPNIIPFDTCENAVCPGVGTHSQCPDMSNVCQGISFPDDCSIPDRCPGQRAPSCPDMSLVTCGLVTSGACGAVCTGTMPDCVGANRATTPCCQDVPGRCGATDCNAVAGGWGTMACPPPYPGPGSGAFNECNPGDVGCPFGADSSCDDPANHPCNEYYDDSHGHGGVCGPGCSGCPWCVPCGPGPAPAANCAGHIPANVPCGQLGPDSDGNLVCAPRGIQGCPLDKPNWTNGAFVFWECGAFQRGSQKTCNFQLASGAQMPADYRYYSVVYSVLGHRHGRSAMSAQGWMVGNGPGYDSEPFAYGTGWPDLGPELGGGQNQYTPPNGGCHFNAPMPYHPNPRKLCVHAGDYMVRTATAYMTMYVQDARQLWMFQMYASDTDPCPGP